MLRLSITLFILVYFTTSLRAQQFAGLTSGNGFPQISQIPYNPSFVVKQDKGLEVSLFSASVLFGTNAYNLEKTSFSESLNRMFTDDDEPAADIAYNKDLRKETKHLWANIDVLGPAGSFTIKDKHHLGLYTRVRQITRAGNLDNDAFQFIGHVSEIASFPDTVQFSEAGFTIHVFSEIGLTYGRTLSNDLHHILKAGVTVKYLAGIAAGSLYTPATNYIKNTADSTEAWEGEVTTLYSRNFGRYVDNDPGNDFGSWANRSGKGSVGLDVGMQYEYHPEGNPNRLTPYTFRIAASITDIGSIEYTADTGSGIYKVHIGDRPDWTFQKQDYEDFISYLDRMKKDTLITMTDSANAFRVGLPAAFRLNTDWNISSNFWMGINMVLNLRGDNGNIYRPGYANLFNVTPRYEKGWFMIGLPLSFVGYQTVSFGTILRAGPVYIGSSSIISTLLRKEINNADAYVSLSFRIPQKNSNNWQQ